MRIEMNRAFCVAAVCCASLSLCATDALPVSESFETDPLAAWSGDGVITGMEYTASGSVGVPISGTHSKVLWVEGTATRTYDDSNSQKRTMDFMVMAESLPDDDLPAADGNEQFRLAFDTNGCFNLYHGYDNAARWTVLSSAYPSGTWVRVTLNIEYPSSDARASCQVLVNGSPCVTEYGYREASLSTAGGSWYQAATNGMKIASVDFAGVGGVDDLVFANSPDYLANYPGGSATTNGVDFAWLMEYGIAADGVDEKASAESAYTAKQSFEAGVDPYSPTPLYMTNATFSSDNIVLTFNGYKADTPTTYVLKSSTSPFTAENAGSTMAGVTFGGDSVGKTSTATVAIPSGNSVTYIQVATTSGSVATTNQFGLLKIVSTNADTIVSAPWVALGVNVEEPSAINVAKLVKTTNLTAGDQLILFDGSSYKAWGLNSGCTEWEPLVIVGGGESVEERGMTLSPGAANTTLSRGQGIMLHRQNPTEGGNAKPFYLYGQYTPAAASTSVAANETALLANPNPNASFSFSSITSPGGNDKIIVPGVGTPKVYTYKDSEWGYDKTEITTVHGISQGSTSRVTNESSVEAGKGFWYKSGGGAPTINW
jgi:hypothetical protein